MKRVWPVVASALALTVGCATGVDSTEPTPRKTSSSPSASPPPTAPDRDAGREEATIPEKTPRTADAVERPVPSAQWQRMLDVGMARPECPVQRREQLRRVDVNHVDFRGGVTRGHVVVNRDVASSISRIFTRLFDTGFPIRGMRSLERFGGNNARSLAADNTAAFNCRTAGAIDINPRENPWRDLRCECWQPGPENNARTPGKGKILEGGVVWRAFIDDGWIWPNIDVADYMHFDTGYPSEPFAGS